MPIVFHVLLSILVPALVRVAEKKFSDPESGTKKRDWVHGMVTDLFRVIGKFLPQALVPEKDEIASFVENVIERVLEKIDP